MLRTDRDGAVTVTVTPAGELDRRLQPGLPGVVSGAGAGAGAAVEPARRSTLDCRRVMPVKLRVLAGPPGVERLPAVERTVEIDDHLPEIRFGRRAGLEIELPFPAVSAPIHARVSSVRARLGGSRTWEARAAPSLGRRGA